jgi:plastocyanin
MDQPRPRRAAPRLLALAPLAAATVLAAAACGGGSSNGSQAGGTPKSSASQPSASSTMPSTSSGGSMGGHNKINGKTVNYHGTKTVAGKQSATIDLEDNYFEPSILKGKPGQKITLHLDNEGEAEHTFTLPGQHIDKTLQAGKKATVKITFPSKTTLFHCRFHDGLGMRGALEPASTGG